MDIDRETIVEIIVSILAVGLFIAATIYVGATYSNGGLSSDGAFALIGIMISFIIVMTGIGYWLSGWNA